MKKLNRLFEKFYDKVGGFINGGKSIATAEMKGFL